MKIQEQIQLLKPLFKGRDDVFALRWEKGNKSGYMPAYHYDPYMYRLHKHKGGTFSNYKDKTYLKLDDHQLSKHIKGEQFVGVSSHGAYPHQYHLQRGGHAFYHHAQPERGIL